MNSIRMAQTKGSTYRLKNVPDLKQRFLEDNKHRWFTTIRYRTMKNLPKWPLCWLSFGELGTGHLESVAIDTHTHTRRKSERIGSFISTTQNVKIKTNHPKQQERRGKNTFVGWGCDRLVVMSYTPLTRMAREPYPSIGLYRHLTATK